MAAWEFAVNIVFMLCTFTIALLALILALRVQKSSHTDTGSSQTNSDTVDTVLHIVDSFLDRVPLRNISEPDTHVTNTNYKKRGRQRKKKRRKS